jgi:opacity protein-like surface antigen
MRAFRAFVTAGVCAVTMTSAARAADPAGTWPLPIKQEIYTDLISGWYARADLGYRWQTIDRVELPPGELITAWTLRDAFTVGFGGGYKHHWFRADVTVDYGNRVRFEGDAPGAPGYYQARIDSITVLANAYLDLGTWWGLTPYVGAGIGGSNIRVPEYANPVISASGGQVENSTRWNLSWAFMAGVSYRFTPKLLLDVGYRYLHLGDARSGPQPPAFTDRTYFRDISAQEVRVGLRVMLD